MNAPLTTVFVLQIGDSEITISIGDKMQRGHAITRVHYHLHAEIHFMMRGKSLISTDAKELLATESNTVIVPPTLVHSVTDYESCERYCITFMVKKTNVPDEDATYETIFSRINEMTELTVLKKNYKKELLNIIKYLQQGDTFHKVSVKHMLSLLLLDLSASLPQKQIRKEASEKEYDKSFHRSIIIESYIDAYHRSPDANIKHLADLLHLCTKQADRTVKHITGMSFKQLLLKQRMHLARELIASGNKKLYEIAQSVGYNSYEVFYKAFSKYFNMSPTDYKNKVQGETIATRKL